MYIPRGLQSPTYPEAWLQCKRRGRDIKQQANSFTACAKGMCTSLMCYLKPKCYNNGSQPTCTISSIRMEGDFLPGSLFKLTIQSPFLQGLVEMGKGNGRKFLLCIKSYKRVIIILQINRNNFYVL